jgi:hypothetical protein
MGQLGDACPFQAPLNATIRLGVGELGKAVGGGWEEVVGELTVQALADNAWEYLSLHLRFAPVPVRETYRAVTSESHIGAPQHALKLE